MTAKTGKSAAVYENEMRQKQLFRNTLDINAVDRKKTFHFCWVYIELHKLYRTVTTAL